LVEGSKDRPEGPIVTKGDVKVAGKDYFLNHFKPGDNGGRPYELLLAHVLEEPTGANHYIQFGYKEAKIEIDLLEVNGARTIAHEAKFGAADAQNTAAVQKILKELDDHVVAKGWSNGFYTLNNKPEAALEAWAKANLKRTVILHIPLIE